MTMKPFWLKNNFISPILLTLLWIITTTDINAQMCGGWATFGSTLNQELHQNGIRTKSKFCPEVDLGMRVAGDSGIVGGAFSASFRWINTENLDWYDDSKFIWDIYVGPSFFIPFDGFESSTGLMINPFIGYSTSAAWFDPDIKSGSFSIKISADIVFHRFSIGAYYRPLKQRIEAKDVSSKGGEYMSFYELEAAPTFGIRIGVVFNQDD